MAEETHISLRHLDNGVACIDIVGDFTNAVTDDFVAAYQNECQPDVKHVVLNFESDAEILSSGIALLIGLIRYTRQKEQTCSATGLSDHFIEVFGFTGLTQYIQLFASEEEAIANRT